MDYLYEVIAMKSRYRRNQSAWQPHLDNTSRFVLSAAARCQHRSKAVILGSGLLLDVPLEELSSMFQEVVLLDIVFLPEIRRRIKRYKNVKLIQQDVTNMAKKLQDSIGCGRPELPAAAPAVSEIDGNTGLVVSLNILSQLWVMPRAYVLKKLRGIDEEHIDDWCKQIVESHYAFLTTIPCTVGLVADTEFIKRDREGTIISRGSTISGLSLPKPDDSWDWNIVPMSENRQYLSKDLHVGAWHVK